MPKINFHIFGVCLSTPGPPDNGGRAPEFSVLTPCVPRSRVGSDCQTQIDALFTFLAVPKENLDPNALFVRKPDYNYEDRVRDHHRTGLPPQPSQEPDASSPRFGHVFLFHRELITLAADPGGGVCYALTNEDLTQKPIQKHSRDARWACHVGEFNHTPICVNPSCLALPDEPVDPKLCTRLLVHSGEVSSAFPCPVVGPTTMFRAEKTVVRYFAQHIVLSVFLDMPALAFNPFVLHCSSFDRRSEDDLESPRCIQLRFVENQDFDVVFSCSNLVTIEDMHKGYCSRHHYDANIDYEFETVYDLLDLDKGLLKPVPQTEVHHGTLIDCIPPMGGRKG